jgi:c-di-GMP-binding flagellar brake protein YcgR
MMELRKPELVDQIRGERRQDKRYLIPLDVRWKLLRRKKTLDSGQGQTVDLSTGGILFHTGRKLPVGLKMQLSIAWPVLLHNSSPLQLTVLGRVVRSDAERTAVEIIQHEFRTVGASPDNGGGRGAIPPSARVPFAFRARA